MNEKFEAPRVSDGCIHRVLHALLVLDGERLSYRALDVEQVGSVYEAMMGYEVERAIGRSIAVRPKHIVVSVDELMEEDGAKRKKWLNHQADCELTAASATVLKEAATAEDVVAALGRRVSPRSLDATGTPRLMAPGTLYLQPGEERRRTGSHYTPRELTEPIVRTTLRPVLEALGDRPTPEQILDLKVCDPAMGSGAFLVETCRHLAERLVTAWELHDAMPQMPADEEPLLHARRLVAQRCLYGVDKNPFAVSLAKLSIWLVTMAKDHAFTFIDHALKNGDSLVGLTRKQIAAFHWKPKSSAQADWIDAKMMQDIEVALGWRDALQGLDEGDYNQKREAWREAENALADARLIGDLPVAAFFGANKDKAREELRNQHRGKVEAWRTNAANRNELEGIVEGLRGGEKPVPPMHWEIEFPEVFGRENPGFDVMVGNPPFLGGKRISSSLGDQYRDWLSTKHDGASSNADLVAHFFRSSFGLLRSSGTLGLVATNTIAQGKTRASGLGWIREQGGDIFEVRRRVRWPGQASVVVSVVHVHRDGVLPLHRLDGRTVETITAFLFRTGPDGDPAKLAANAGLSYIGTLLLGMGFTFDDSKTEVTPRSEMKRLIAEDPRNAERIRPYIGGSEVNTSPTQSHHRYAIDFEDMTEAQARQWPSLMRIVEEKVRPSRAQLKRAVYRNRWWQFGERQAAMLRAKEKLERVIVVAQTSNSLAFAFQPANRIFGHTLVVFPVERHSFFGVLQSRLHQLWTLFFAAKMKDDARYIPTDCFETFPAPANWQTDSALEAAGKTYYEYRADLMVRREEGLTATYNRFHDPEERDPDTLKLGTLHGAMDRAVLDAYGWHDIPTDCEFLLDYEIDEETWGTKKKPYRYRWPEAVHDEVLSRLLDLNQKRHEDEVAAGLQAEKGRNRSAPKKTKPKDESASDARLPLFDSMNRPEEA